MKNLIYYIVILLLVLCLNSCNSNAQGFQSESSCSDYETFRIDTITDELTAVNTTVNESTADAIPETTIDYSDIDNIPEEYRAVLNNEKKFVIDIQGAYEEIYLDNFSFPYMNQFITDCDDVKYAVIDMNGDNQVEVIITGALGDVLVLHSENGLVYGFDYIFSNMEKIKIDGTFDWYDMGEYGLTYGTSKLEFYGEKCVRTKLCSVENEGSDQVRYYIGKELVTKQEYLNYENKLEKIELIWFPIDLYSS